MSPANNDTLHHLAFDNSLQANIIITVSSGRIIAANTTACKLLGYSKKELLSKTITAAFDIDESTFKPLPEQTIAEGHSAIPVKAITKSGRKISSEITYAVFIDEDGVEMAIITITDLSRSIRKQKLIDIKQEKINAGNILLAKSKQKKIDAKKEKIVADNIILAVQKSDARLVENNEWIRYIAKTSYDVMWDWDIASGEIYVGDSIREVFGYKVRNNTVNFEDFSTCLVQGEKGNIERRLFETLASSGKSWKDTYMFKRQDGSIATTTSRASIVRNEEGKATRLIGATHDVSRLQELEMQLEEQAIQEENKSRLAANISFDVIWDWDLSSNEMFIGEEFEELFGYSIKNNKGKIGDKESYLHMDDREAYEQGLKRAIASSATRWEHAYRFTRADGSLTAVFDRANIIRHADGKAYRMIGAMQDLNPQRKAEESLNSQIFIKANRQLSKKAGLATEGKKSLLIEKVKNVIVELVRYSDEQPKTNFSDFLSKKLQYDYTYLANIFSLAEGITIQKFIMLQKIDLAKELLINDGLKLTDIAWKLHYSSVAHLSNQFKKVTGQTPSYFKKNVRQANLLNTGKV